MKCIQAAVRVLFQLIEVDKIELVLIVRECAEKSNAKVVVWIKKAAKIGIERLNPGANEHRVITVIEIVQLNFAERLLERRVGVGPVCSATDIDVDDAVLAGVKVIRNAECGRDLECPIARLENRIALEELKWRLNRFIDRKAFGTAEKVIAVRVGAADVVAGRRPADLDAGRADARQDHKIFIANDRVIAFQDVTVVGVVPCISPKRYVAPPSAFVAVTVIFGKLVTPSIANLAAVGVRLHFGFFFISVLIGWCFSLRDLDLNFPFAAVDYHVLEDRALFLFAVAKQIWKNTVLGSFALAETRLERRPNRETIGPGAQIKRIDAIRLRNFGRRFAACLVGGDHRNARDRLAAIVDNLSRQLATWGLGVGKRNYR